MSPTPALARTGPPLLVRTDPADHSGSERELRRQIAISRIGIEDGEGGAAGLHVAFADKNQLGPVRISRGDLTAVSVPKPT